MTSLEQTTSSPTVVDADGVDDLGEGPETEQAPSAWRRRPLVLTVAALVLVGIVVASWAGYRAWDARIDQALVTATGDLSAAAIDLEGAVVAGEATLVDSDGRVGDEAVRTDLADALTQAATFTPAVPEGSRQEQTDAAASLTTEARAHLAAVAGATALTVESVEAWDLEQASAAHETAADRLIRATDAAQRTLAASEGQVADNAVREQLLAQIEAATAVEPVVVDESAAVVDQTAALETATTELTTTADTLDAAHQDVIDAQGAWQVEQERIAAEQAAQAARAAEEIRRSMTQAPTSRTTTSAPSSNSSSSSARPSTSGTATAPSAGKAPAASTPSTPAPSAPAPAAPAPAPAPAPGQGGWVESGSDTWCGEFDTSGAEGTGAWC